MRVGLYDDVPPGTPRTIDDERIAQLINTTLHTKPQNGSTHWSVRGVAEQTTWWSLCRAMVDQALGSCE